MVVKMAKTMKSRRLRKRVRKTFGALFLASAIAVAAIPVDDLQAESPADYKMSVSLTNDNTSGGILSMIPFVDPSEPIYADGDFTFAYVPPRGSTSQSDKVAVILRYNGGSLGTSGVLTIPETVDVYGKYTASAGTAGGYVALNQELKFLFWKQDVQDVDAYGNPLYEQMEQNVTYYKLEGDSEIPVSDWKSNADGVRIPKKKIGADGNPLTNTDGSFVYETDQNGNIVYETETRSVKVDDLSRPKTHPEYYPCYYSSKDGDNGWEKLGKDRLYILKELNPATGELYPYDRLGEYNGAAVDAGIYEQTTNPDKQWITDVDVAYIGNQNLTEDEDTKDLHAGAWITAKDVDEGKANGIFHDNGNIKKLVISSKLVGIGDYAFHYCTALEEITFGDGLQVIGNHAFDNCAGITKINIPKACRLTTLGDHAFYGCQNLQSFAMPTSVRSIGDGAFENCYAMTQIDLHDALVLNTIGDHAFRNCRSLQSLVIPEGVKDNSNYANGGKGKGNTLQLNMIEGCTALQYVTLVNPQANFAESKTPNSSTDFTFENFKAALKQRDTFYFEGVNSRLNGNGDVAPGTLHATANDNGIAFKFYGEKYAGQYDIYEIVIKEEPGSATNNNKAIYRVASNDELIYCSIDEGMKNVVIPPAIGPAHIRTISSTSFGGNCFLEKVTIPSSVQKIEANAFRGCHHLTDVIFESPISLRAGDIGANAFKTQDVTVHQRTCTGDHQALLTGDKLKLTFTGEISPASGPFAYAMDANNNINSGSQERTYVTFYSGWPTNLAVQYNPDTKKNELIDYPTFEDLKSGTKYTEANYPYITKEYADAARDAVKIYNGDTSHPQTDDERAVIDAALDIKLPQGIEAVKRIYKDANDEIGQSLFAIKEANEDKVNKVITTEGIAEIPARTFEGCKNLKELYIWGATSSIGDYAFKDCANLETVEISSNVNSMGLRPFAGCPNVSYVSFQGGPNYVCSDSIIYGLNGGQKETLIECLEARGRSVGSTTVKAEELAGVTGIAEEAFYDVLGVGIVDLRQSSIDKVPQKAFMVSTDNNGDVKNSKLFAVYLPKTCQQIQKNAFKNSPISAIEIPGSVTYIDPNAFNTNLNSPHDADQEDDGIKRIGEQPIEFVCEANSTASIFADNTQNITIGDEIAKEFKVTFVAINPEDPANDVRTLDIQSVMLGKDAVPPMDKIPEFEGYVFTGWYPSYEAIGGDVTIEARYKSQNPEDTKFTVTFMDEDGVTVLGTDRVFPGEDAKPPVAPGKDGYRFIGWVPSYTAVQQDATVYARYEKIDSDESRFTVTFMDEDGMTLLGTDRVFPGEDAKAPTVPEKEGYRFVGWAPPCTNITKDTTVLAKYEKVDSAETKYTVNFYGWNTETGKTDKLISTQRIGPGESVTYPETPSRPDHRFTGWNPDVTSITKDVDTYAQYDYAGPGLPTPTPDPNATPAPTATPGPNGTPAPTATPNPGATAVPGIYTLTVRNGSGSGSYIVGAQVIVLADNPDNNSEFSGWTVEPATAVVTSKDMMGTVLIMPESNVIMTANYKPKTNTGSTGTTGRPSGSTGNGSTGNGTTTGSSNGTTVVINKNGLSNTGVVSVTVNGSSDNFVVKISEDSNATEAVLRALMSEYGDISKLAYFPMDISLYDSTGTTKITDTTGLAVNITLPIPDSLIPYAGNNKVAGVVDGRLDRLSPQFKTISGVPCISFTATHFSPYVIYVDTTDLSEGFNPDSTPKTGDGIHPKWFLAMGLACISFILFIKKDRRPVPVKVAAR